MDVQVTVMSLFCNAEDVETVNALHDPLTLVQEW